MSVPDFTTGACSPAVRTLSGSTCTLWLIAFCVSVIQEKTVGELELRVKQQSVEVEKGNALRQKVTQEKAQLEIHIASISAELQEANRRSGAV